MTSKSITARENRRRQKLRQRRPRADVRKVHRYGVPRNSWGQRKLIRYEGTSECGLPVTPMYKSRAVPDEAFVWLPPDVQCKRCRDGAWPMGRMPFPHEHGTHDHLMAVELLVAMLQRMWQARLEVGHRCWMSGVHVILSDNGYAYAVPEAAFYPLGTCTCGAASWTDPRRWEWEIATAQRPNAKYCYSNLCSKCGHQFFTDRPRGQPPSCNMCRGKLVCDERLSDFELDTFSEAYLDAVDAMAVQP